MSWLSDLEGDIEIGEQQIATALAKAWTELQSAETVVVDNIAAIFTWIKNNQTSLLSLFQGFLTDAAAIGSVIPGIAPEVTAATTAIDAATAAVDVLSQGYSAGSTPLSTIVNAYGAVKNAQSAVNTVLEAGTSQPANATASATTPAASS
jgi:hypothetical protein